MTTSPAPSDQAELFRKLAAGYDTAIRWYQPTYDAMLRLSTDLARVAASGRERCLDYGCGTGAALPLLCLLFEEIVAIDPGRAMLDLARKRADAECTLPGAGSLSFIEGSFQAAEAAILGEASFDAIHCSLVLSFVKERAEKLEVLRYFHKTLRPGAPLVLTELVASADPAAEQSTFALWRALMRHRGASEAFIAAAEGQVHAAMHRCTPEQLRELLEEVGFKSIEQPYQTLHTHILLASK